MPDHQILLTTSWDDGHELDAKLAQVLDDNGCSGTFYVSPRSREIPPDRRIRDSSLQDLSTRFEIGGHTLTHRRLTRIPETEAAREITEGKRAVEDALGRPITSFCYPYGAFDPVHVTMVRNAGFRVGRTARRFLLDLPTNPLEMGTTTHAARYRRDIWPISRLTMSPYRAIRMWRDWDILARQVIGGAFAEGGVVHIWGHSWEIEQNRDWVRLSRLLGELTGRDDVTMLTNGELAGRLGNLP